MWDRKNPGILVSTHGLSKGGSKTCRWLNSGERGRSTESLVDCALLENTLTDFIRNNTFIACVVVCCNNKRVGRSDLQSRSNIVGDIPYDCENRRTICAGTAFAVHLIACHIALRVGIPCQCGG